MKSAKRYLALVTALLLMAAMTACAPAQEPTQTPTQAPTQTPTQAPTEAPAEVPTQASTEAPAASGFSAFEGYWYSGKVTCIIKEDQKWVMQYNEETFMAGNYALTRDGHLALCDTEGFEAAIFKLEADGTVYAELYAEVMYSRIEDFTFTRTKPENVDSNVIEEPAQDVQTPE